jgi:hypothetical protein
VIYLLHSTVSLHRGKGLNVRHYLGWSATQETALARVRQHQNNTSRVKLVRAFHAKGASLVLVKTWPDGGPALERYLKEKGHLDQHCPLCRPLYLAREREKSRVKRALSKLQSPAPSSEPARTIGGTSPAHSPGRRASTVGKSRRGRNPVSGTSSGSATPPTRIGGDDWLVRVLPARTPDTSSAGTERPSS